METTKISESEMTVLKTAPVVEPVENTYSIDFLKEQEVNILKQMNDFVEARQKELDEVRALIVEAGKLGLKTKEELQADAVVTEEAQLVKVIK